MKDASRKRRPPCDRQVLERARASAALGRQQARGQTHLKNLADDSVLLGFTRFWSDLAGFSFQLSALRMSDSALVNFFS
jgi:hypothetical protein